MRWQLTHAKTHFRPQQHANAHLSTSHSLPRVRARNAHNLPSRSRVVNPAKGTMWRARCTAPASPMLQPERRRHIGSASPIRAHEPTVWAPDIPHCTLPPPKTPPRSLPHSRTTYRSGIWPSSRASARALEQATSQLRRRVWPLTKDTPTLCCKSPLHLTHLPTHPTLELYDRHVPPTHMPIHAALTHKTTCKHDACHTRQMSRPRPKIHRSIVSAGV